jgi:CDP-diacylglycerol--serine O-phosphatidyltransferase
MPSFLIRSIPNTLTCCNLLSGAIATKLAFDGSTTMALTFIIIGAVFDFFDGFSARLLHVSSPIGKELDSLADDITFGLAPASIAFMLMADFNFCADGFAQFLPYLAFLIAAFSALRLAKFNLDKRQTTSFIGLPTPANALFWGAFAIGFRTYLLDAPLGLYIVLALVLLSSGLLVAEIPMFALKFKTFKWKDNSLRYIFLLTSLIIILFFHTIGIAIAIVWYILLSLLTQKKQEVK